MSGRLEAPTICTVTLGPICTSPRFYYAEARASIRPVLGGEFTAWNSDGSLMPPTICQWAHKIDLCTTDSLGSSADHSHSGPEAGSVALYWRSGTRRQVKHCSHPTGELEYEPGFHSVFPIRRNGEGNTLACGSTRSGAGRGPPSYVSAAGIQRGRSWTQPTTRVLLMR